MIRAPRGPDPNTACVAALYRSQPRHFCAAASSVRTLVLFGTNGAAERVPPGLASGTRAFVFFATLHRSAGPGHRGDPRNADRPTSTDSRAASSARQASEGGIPSGLVQELGLIITFAGGLSAALVFGYVTHRLGLSPIVGYLLAGVALGPHTPGLMANPELAEQLAEVGVILLMFGVGLQFHAEELLAVRRVAIPGAAAGIASATLLGAWAAWLFGWSWTSSLVFGLTLSVASTVVLVRVLSDNRQLHTSSGHIAVGWLVVEDLLTVLILVLLPTVTGADATIAGILGDVALTLLKVGLLIAVAGVAGARIIPKLLDLVAATRSRELFTLTVLVLALGIALASTLAFGVSMALGAFIAGMSVGRSDYSLRAATDALPMRDAFAVLFFVSIGMLLNPLDLFSAPWLGLAALGVVVVAKPLVAALVLTVMRYPIHTVLTVPAALAQIGEFSF